ncbi:hypothetical protein HDU98_011728 [Podochytrium sp. JEL0797]|nr:hypothetical protein HDU98_011728 [Podochytrium sp. JEL0797]
MDFDPSSIAIANSLSANLDEPVLSDEERIASKKRAGILTSRASHNSLLLCQTQIAALFNDERKAKPPRLRKNLRKRQWSQVLRDVENALQTLAQALVECDAADIAEPFDVFFECKTHLLILRLIPIDATAELLPIVHQLTSSSLRFFNVVIENIGKDYILFLLFSNNYINDVISFQSWGFRLAATEGDADFRADGFNFFVTLLKNLSNNLNSSSINFFLNEHVEDFPLFNEALCLFESEERMVRNSARIVTLNVFRLNDATSNEYLVKTIHAFDQLSLLWEKEIVAIDAQIKFRPVSLESGVVIETALKDCIDTLLYFDDVFQLANPTISSSLAASLMRGAVPSFLLDQLFNHLSVPSFLNDVSDSILSVSNRDLFLSALDSTSWISKTDELIPLHTPLVQYMTLLASMINSKYTNREAVIRWITETSAIAPDIYSSTELDSEANAVMDGSTRNNEVVDRLIEILGSTHASSLPPFCIELIVWILEQVLESKERDMEGSTKRHVEALMKLHDQWQISIYTLVNDGVDMVVDLLEYETAQPPTDLSRLLQDTRLLVHRATKSGESTNLSTEVYDMCVLVRMWRLVSRCLIKLGEIGVRDAVHEPVSVDFDADAILLTSPTSPTPIFSHPSNHITCILSNSDPTALEMHYQGMTFADKSTRFTSLFSMWNGYEVAWRDESKWDRVRVEFESLDVRERMFRCVEEGKVEVLEARRVEWLNVLKKI